MRGDSVRDLYAKALALLGLAVLAGAGALVDYWPVQGRLPAVSFSYSLPPGPAPLEARVALTSRVAVPQTQPRVTAAPVVAAPVPASADMRVVTVPADEPVAAPTAPAPVSAIIAPAAIAAPTVEPPQPVVFDLDPSLSMVSEPTDAPRVSHSEDVLQPSSSNVLQKAGGQLLNVGFTVGTGVAKSFSAFGTAFGNIGKLFIR